MRRNPILTAVVAAVAAFATVGAGTATATGAAAATAPTSRSWTPQAAAYGTHEDTNVPVTMSDGTVLRADVYYPTDKATGQDAAGPFPVLLQQTPYGKEAMADSYFVERGYIEVVADVRGTGDSQGSFGLFDPVQASDGAALVRWAARLPHSDGRVGLFGESYMGIDQFLTAAQLGADSPLKALFPVITGNDLYRDTAYQGGLFDSEFDAAYTGLTATLNTVNPAAETAMAGNEGSAAALPGVQADHAGSLASYYAASAADNLTGGDQSYDAQYWSERNPVETLDKVVADKIPAFLVGGWSDLFQRGEPLNWVGLENAYDHRSVYASLAPGQKLTARYQLMMGPWYHLTAGDGVDLDQIELEWFDTWLFDQDTGMSTTADPVHLYMLGADKWVDTSAWPPSGGSPTSLYLGGGPSGSSAPSDNDGTLARKAPTSSSGSDSLAWTGTSSPCGGQTDQWAMGGADLGTEGGAPPDPCTTDDRTTEAGPGSVTYTSAPMTAATVLEGPVDATLYATSTAKDTEWVVSLEDVAPGGAATPLTSGALLGSFRAVDSSRSWKAGGRLLLPYHPYTQASSSPVPVGRVVRYDIEVFPTFAELAPGHRLRVTIRTGDSHLLPNPTQTADLSGGTYQLERDRSASSYLEVELSPASSFTRSCALCQ